MLDTIENQGELKSCFILVLWRFSSAYQRTYQELKLELCDWTTVQRSLVRPLEGLWVLIFKYKTVAQFFLLFIRIPNLRNPWRILYASQSNLFRVPWAKHSSLFFVCRFLLLWLQISEFQLLVKWGFYLKYVMMICYHAML